MIIKPNVYKFALKQYIITQITYQPISIRVTLNKYFTLLEYEFEVKKCRFCRKRCLTSDNDPYLAEGPTCFEILF